MPRASLHTLGCRLNQAETAIIAKTLVERGFAIVDWGELADLSVINTCTVTEQADSKCRQAVRQAIKQNPSGFVAVVGCYAQMASQTVAQIDGVDLIVGNGSKLKVTEYLNGLSKNSEPVVMAPSLIPRDDFVIESVGLYDSHTRANLKLQDGCDFACSFCIIPRARGRSRSRVFGDVIAEASTLADNGFKEIVLTGVNIGVYNSGGKTILDVVREMEKISGLERIRISSIELSTIDWSLVEHMAGSDKLCNYLHVPLQSGDDGILQAMGRKHDARVFAEFVERVTATVPGVGIGTDVMVGFPGEGDAEFRSTKTMLADLPVEYFHVFSYSDRTGTPSSRMTAKVDSKTRKIRSAILTEMSKRKRRAFYENHLGGVAEVLFETYEAGRWDGLTGNYMRVVASSDGDLSNQIRPVRLKSIEGDVLRGELV
jgi:threonylcarbamoyladenosine tRNA methylthiotransferase MtaB